MITLKELVEWHLSTEQLPNTDEICIGSGLGDRRGECFYNAETRMWCWMNSPYVEDEAPPKWWAYMPKGPE